MPTTKLSRDFYDRFGDKVVDELVGLLNEMDAGFRSELRELNEHNARRFEAKVEQRTAELAATLRIEMTELAAGLRAAMANLAFELRGEMATLASDLRGDMATLASDLRGEMATLASDLRGEMATLASDLRGDMATMDTRLRGEIASLRQAMSDLRAELIKWMFLFWLGTVATMLGFGRILLTG